MSQGLLPPVLPLVRLLAHESTWHSATLRRLAAAAAASVRTAPSCPRAAATPSAQHLALAAAPPQPRRFHVQQVGSSDASTEATSNFTLDSVPPNTTISEMPDPIRTADSATFQFTASKEGSSFMCS